MLLVSGYGAYFEALYGVCHLVYVYVECGCYGVHHVLDYVLECRVVVPAGVVVQHLDFGGAHAVKRLEIGAIP